jgi:hypothetical protein
LNFAARPQNPRLVGTVINTLIAITAGSTAVFLVRLPTWVMVQRWLMGTVLAALAVKMAEARR